MAAWWDGERERVLSCSNKLNFQPLKSILKSFSGWLCSNWISGHGKGTRVPAGGLSLLPRVASRATITLCMCDQSLPDSSISVGQSWKWHTALSLLPKNKDQCVWRRVASQPHPGSVLELTQPSLLWTEFHRAVGKFCIPKVDCLTPCFVLITQLCQKDGESLFPYSSRMISGETLNNFFSLILKEGNRKEGLSWHKGDGACKSPW